MNTRLADNAGEKCCPGALNATPDHATDSQQLTNAAADTDTTATVVAGRSYLVVPTKTGGFYLGLADVTTAANVKWAVALGGPGVVVHIPVGYTSLHYATVANGGIAYLIPLPKGN